MGSEFVQLRELLIRTITRFDLRPISPAIELQSILADLMLFLPSSPVMGVSRFEGASFQEPVGFSREIFSLSES